MWFSVFFFFNDTATTEIYTLSLHDALPIYWLLTKSGFTETNQAVSSVKGAPLPAALKPFEEKGVTFLELSQEQFGKVTEIDNRSEEHTSELQSRQYLVCRLLLEKKNKMPSHPVNPMDSSRSSPHTTIPICGVSTSPAALSPAPTPPFSALRLPATTTFSPFPPAL